MASMGVTLASSSSPGFPFMAHSLNRRLVKDVRLTFDDADGPSRTLAQTGAQSVAEIVGGKNRLTIHDLYGAFSA